MSLSLGRHDSYYHPGCHNYHNKNSPEYECIQSPFIYRDARRIETGRGQLSIAKLAHNLKNNKLLAIFVNIDSFLVGNESVLIKMAVMS